MGTFFQDNIANCRNQLYWFVIFPLLLIPQQPLAAEIPTESHLPLSAQKKNLIIYSILGVVCLATVAGLVTHVVCFCVVLLGIIVTDRALIRRGLGTAVDICLLFPVFWEFTTN